MKWSIGHKCSKRELSVLLMEEKEDERIDYNGFQGTEAPLSSSTETPSKVSVQPEVSLNSVIGLSNLKTMKLLGLIDERRVVVMIDPGATHNFISLNTVHELSIPVAELGSFGVLLGN